jgi:hypothetical protein
MNTASVARSLSLASVFALQMIMPASADDCAPVLNALTATASAPKLRQYVSMPSRPGVERLVSVQIGDVVYVALGVGGPASPWQKMSRSKMRAEAEEAMQTMNYRDCKPLGSEVINGSQVSAFEYTMQDQSAVPGQIRSGGRSRIWIGSDGLVRKQEVAGGSVRYEYNAVEAPN